MRKKLSLCLYMLLVDVVACYLVVVPAYAFQVSVLDHGVCAGRVTSGCVGDDQAAQRSATQAAALASAVAAAPSGGSVALRVVAGAWLAGARRPGRADVVAMIYLDSNKTAAIQGGGGHAWCVDGSWRDGADYGGAAGCQCLSGSSMATDGAEWLFLHDRPATDRSGVLCKSGDCPHGSPLHGGTVLCAGKTDK